MSEPVVYSERVLPAQAVPAKKILVVIDMQLEYEAQGTRMNADRETRLKSFYEPAAKAIVEAIKKRGSDAEYLLLHDGAPPIKIDSTYSHMWTQTLTGATKRTDLRGGDISLFERKWTGIIRQRSPANQILRTEIYRTEYQSDGILCFYPLLAVTNKEACQNTYINALIGQLTKAGVQP